MNVNNGEVLGLGSSPSFDPNLFSKIIRKRDLDRVYSKDNGEPILNRAIQGRYPTGSTFKLITATAALEGGLITPDTVQFDGGSIQVGDVDFQNAGKAVHGAVALRKALSVSSDVYFYRLGQEANGSGNGLLIQDWAKRLGLGRPDRHRSARARRRASSPRRSTATTASRSSRAAWSARTPRRRRSPSESAASSTGRGAWVTT